MTIEYWPTGLLKAIHDPRNFAWATSYTYTARSQLETATDALNHQTFFHYDPAGNVDYIDRPDTKRETRSYDEMNRLVTAIEPVTDTTNKTTTFTYWPSGRVKTVEDSNHQITRFDYDYFDRQQYMFYPDNSFQQWDYDGTGNLQGRRTVGGNIQRFQPDGRNRITDTWWDPEVE
jgi:YD repeat-containing protein